MRHNNAKFIDSRSYYKAAATYSAYSELPKSEIVKFSFAGFTFGHFHSDNKWHPSAMPLEWHKPYFQALALRKRETMLSCFALYIGPDILR